MVLPDPTGSYAVTLYDGQGNAGSGSFAVDPDRRLSTGTSWGQFQVDYVQGEPGEDDLKAFGRDLFTALFEESSRDLHGAWKGVLGGAGQRALELTVRFGPQTERFSALPLELLHDGQSYLFRRPGSALRRAYDEAPAKAFRAPDRPRVLFAWACPAGAGDAFEPEPHLTALTSTFGEENVTRLDDASLEGIAGVLASAAREGRPFGFLHLLAHGFRGIATSGVCLAQENGALDPVEAEDLAEALRGSGISLAFLCSCQTAVAGGDAFSGVGQQLIAPRGADLPCAVATQANLPVAGSADLAERFYRSLLDGTDPGIALSRARAGAYRAGRAWSVPVILARPPEVEEAPRKRQLAGLPTKRGTYLSRERLEAEVVDALREARLVSLVGLPGIGKTEAGREAARRVEATDLVARTFYREANAGMTASAMRLLLANALDLAELPDEDAALGAAFDALGEPVLVVIDNAEDLMRTAAAQAEFRELLDGMLQHSERLRVLLTTRWPVESTDEPERLVEVPPLSPEETATLLEREIKALGTLRPEWPGSAAWNELVALLDGHPRSLWLISRHFQNPRTTPQKVLERLRTLRDAALVTPDLLGRADAYAALGDEHKLRLKSLVASMDLSFEVLQERHPEAVEAFVALSLFPDGLPQEVAEAVTGSWALDRLYNYHLVQWHADRTFYPVPLGWYAQRRRAEHPVDENACRQRALDGFAIFVEECDRMVISGAINAGIDRLIPEQNALQEIVEWAATHETATEGRSSAARIAAAAGNVLGLVHLHQLRSELTRSALEAALGAGDRLGEANCLKSLGDLHLRLDELETARDSYQEALTIYREIRARLGEANCLQSLGDLHLRLDELEPARDSYQKALPIYREIRDRLGEANCLKSLGDLHLRIDELETARDSYQRALTIYREIRDRLGEANCLQSLGDLHLRTDELETARDSYQKALPIYREIRARLGEANCLQSLGDLHLRIDELETARDSYQKALPIYREIRARLGEANCLKSLGDLHLRLDELETARDSYQRALNIYREIRDRLGEANCLQSLGDLHLRLDELETARDSYQRALPICREIRDRLGEANCLQSLGDLHLRLDELEPARDSYQKALPIYREIRDRLGEANCLRSLGLLALASGESSAASRTFRDLLDLYREIRDGLGEQASLGYLARTAARAGRDVQSVALAERSLEIGRRIGDRFGQTINLELQIGVWVGQEDFAPALAAMLLHRELCREIGDAARAARFETVLDQALPALPLEARAALEKAPEAFRRAGVEAAEVALAEAGTDPLEPW